MKQKRLLRIPVNLISVVGKDNSSGWQSKKISEFVALNLAQQYCIFQIRGKHGKF